MESLATLSADIVGKVDVSYTIAKTGEPAAVTSRQCGLTIDPEAMPEGMRIAWAIYLRGVARKLDNSDTPSIEDRARDLLNALKVMRDEGVRVCDPTDALEKLVDILIGRAGA